jgi:peptidylprolyl isomerase
VTATAACASADGDGEADGALAEVDVSDDVGTKPTVDLETPFALEASESRVVVEGEGEEVAEDDTISVEFLAINGTDGAELGSSYEQGPQTVTLNAQGGPPVLIDALTGRQVGDRLIIGLSPADSAPDPSDGASAPASVPQDTLLYVVDILDLVPSQAEGEQVTDLPAGLPTVETDGTGAVTGVSVPEETPPTDLVVQPLIVGEGDPVEADDTLQVQYWGVLWDGGETFDSSWERGAPASFPLTQVIAGWTQGLEGQPVGSRVLLLVPPDLGYGAEGQPPSIPADATLVFVVDILSAG